MNHQKLIAEKFDDYEDPDDSVDFDNYVKRIAEATENDYLTPQILTSEDSTGWGGAAAKTTYTQLIGEVDPGAQLLVMDLAPLKALMKKLVDQQFLHLQRGKNEATFANLTPHSQKTLLRFVRFHPSSAYLSGDQARGERAVVATVTAEATALTPGGESFTLPEDTTGTSTNTGTPGLPSTRTVPATPASDSSSGKVQTNKPGCIERWFPFLA